MAIGCLLGAKHCVSEEESNSAFCLTTEVTFVLGIEGWIGVGWKKEIERTCVERVSYLETGDRCKAWRWRVERKSRIWKMQLLSERKFPEHQGKGLRLSWRARGCRGGAGDAGEWSQLSCGAGQQHGRGTCPTRELAAPQLRSWMGLVAPVFWELWVFIWNATIVKTLWGQMWSSGSPFAMSVRVQKGEAEAGSQQSWALAWRDPNHCGKRRSRGRGLPVVPGRRLWCLSRAEKGETRWQV